LLVGGCGSLKTSKDELKKLFTMFVLISCVLNILVLVCVCLFCSFQFLSNLLNT